ncbi:MAG TPA: c-type cytochrome [Candidatus Acidoferrum sp.]|nr:c-type cytochrome [Candidatus Acidoferrum sp.]
MSANPPSNLKIRKILFASVLVLICITLIYSGYQQNKPWVVPEEVKKLKNPVPPSESALKAAGALYMEECAQCHGDHGKGDGPEAAMHRPSPADLTDPARMNSVTDGEIFYQIAEGRRPMPSFKNRLTQDQRWQLVLFVRSFSQLPTAPH